MLLESSSEPDLELWVPGSPEPAGSKTVGYTKGGHAFVRPANPRQKTWQQYVRDAAASAWRSEPSRLPIALQLDFQFLRPRAHFGTRGLRPSAPRHKVTKPDVVKLARAVEDALSGIVFADDAQVVTVIACKEFAARVGVRIRIWQLEGKTESESETRNES